MHGEVFIVVYLSYSVVGGFKHKHFVYTTDPYNTDPYNNNLTQGLLVLELCFYYTAILRFAQLSKNCKQRSL